MNEDSMRIKLTLNPNVQIAFAWVATACRQLFEDALGQGGVSVTLTDWNNNHGVEFDILQSVFPEPIPLAVQGKLTPRPDAVFTSLSELILFVSVAMQVDASVVVKATNGEELFLHDTSIEIETMNRAIADSSFLMENV